MSDECACEGMRLEHGRVGVVMGEEFMLCGCEMCLCMRACVARLWVSVVG